MSKTRRNVTRVWYREKQGLHQRTKMLRNCGKKCFLGKNKSFPICTKNTCRRNKKGVYAAYVRAREYSSKTKSLKYKKIASRAARLLKKN